MACYVEQKVVSTDVSVKNRCMYIMRLLDIVTVHVLIRYFTNNPV